MGKKMQVVGGKALLSTGRGSHLLPSSCCSLFVVLPSPVRSSRGQEGGQSTLQLLGTRLGLLCPGQEGWLVAQPQVFRDKEPQWWLCPRWGTGSSCSLAGAVNGTLGLDRSLCIQAGHHGWAGLSPNLSPVLLLFCSLCLTNSLGFSWFLFQLLPLFCRFSTFPVPLLACCSCCQDPQCLPASSQIPFPFRWLQRYFGLLAALPDSALKRSICGWVFPVTEHGQGLAAELLAGLWLWGWGLWGCTFSQWGSVLLILPRCLWAGEGLAGGLLPSH